MLFSPAIDAAIFGVLGLLIGSFLNVVIYRLPKILEAEWAANCAELAGSESKAAEPFNLMRPRSMCPSCRHTIRWYENIPVASYVFLRGKCGQCGVPISLRYPIIEIVTAGFFVWLATLYGVTLTGFAWAAFACLLIAQFFIDFDTQLLPDDLNYLILWLGLIAAALGWTSVPLKSAVWGVVWGYLSLWIVYQVHHGLTGKQGMGHGDFKLLAALGAWFGADYLIALILLSSIVGAVIGGMLLLIGRLANRDIPIPFGPFLAGAGLVGMVAGPGRLEAIVPFAFPFSNLAR
jgi:leader peptidase (prepilin peptidase)/N-methyltransferase